MKILFPFRFFGNLFKVFIALTIPLQLLTVGLVAILYDISFWNLKFFILLFALIFMTIISGLVLGYRFAKPLKQVILSAVRLSSKRIWIDHSENDQILEDDYGDYFELERALEKARRKLTKRRLQLDKEREESQTLMIAIEDAVVSCDLDFRIQYFNSRFANQFMPFRLIQMRQVFREPEVTDIFEKAVASGIPQIQTIRLLSLVDNTYRFYSVTVSPLREEKSHLHYGILALFHDITEIKKAEQVRIEFVQNASHELRTPLTSMKGYIETLKDDIGNKNYSQAEDFLKIISRSVDRLTELVNDMLTIASLEGTYSRIHKENVSIGLLTQEVIERLLPMANEKNIIIQFQCDTDNWNLDLQKTEQVLINLISNAIKYIPKNGHIKVLWKTVSAGIELHVQDDGPGIAQEHLGRLFERFYRIDKGRSRDVGGTGLGLSIVKHIVQSHGGQIGVHSEIGIGSDFFCFFPL